jgi:hypothetical protein
VSDEEGRGVTYPGEDRGRRRRDERSRLHNTGDEEACNILIEVCFRVLPFGCSNYLERTVQRLQSCIYGSHNGDYEEYYLLGCGAL